MFHPGVAKKEKSNDFAVWSNDAMAWHKKYTSSGVIIQ